MRDIQILLFVLLLVIALWLVSRKWIEAFVTKDVSTTMEEKISDRFNQFTGLVKAEKNPIAPLGITPTDAKKVRALHKTALNIPTLQTEGFADEITIPITTSEDMMSMAKMCKDKAESLSNPFDDPDFAAQCGVCMTDGTYFDGSTFDAKKGGRGAGLLVYDKRKTEAIAKQEQKGYAFPHATPFNIQNKNTCRAATESDNAEPVFAITADWYDKFKKREACIHGKTLSNKGSKECGICFKNKQHTWLDPVQTTNRSSFLVWGKGQLAVSINGSMKAQGFSLNMSSPTEVNLGGVTEGDTIQVNVENAVATDTEAPFIYIALKGENAPKEGKIVSGQRNVATPSFFDAFPFFSIDAANTGDAGKSILRLGKRQFSGLKGVSSLTGIKGSKNPTNNQVNKIQLEGVMPLTFIDSANVMAGYDCDNSPLMTLDSSAEKLLDDPCLRNPKGQGPGSFSDDCLRSLITEGTGCTTLGSLAKGGEITLKGRKTNLRTLAGNRTKQQFIEFVQKEIATPGKLDPELSMLCTGKDISTPCDAELKNPNADPNSMSQQCLTYLYKNAAKEDEARIGLAYGTEKSPYTSARMTGEASFCQGSGQMNPETAGGLAIFRSKIRELSKGLRGVEAVKETLKQVFQRAVGDLPIDKEDSEGGRATSYRLCFDKNFSKPAPNTDSRTAQGQLPASTTTMTSACVPNIRSDTFTISRTNSLLTPRRPIWMRRNFEVSFLLRPTGIVPQWANILRFSRTFHGNTVDVPEDCCLNGVRALGIWFWPGTTRLHIRIGHERDGNWGGNEQTVLQINTTYQIYIRADGQNVTFRISDINKSTPIFNETYNTSRFGSRYEGWVSIWGGDGWYTPARGVISELCLKNL